MDEAWKLFQAHRDGRMRLIAPYPVYYELPSSVLKAVRRRRIDPAGARRAIDLFLALPLPILAWTGQEARDLISQSYDLAELLSRSFYDALFVSTARSLDLPLVTADKPLFEAGAALSLPIVWLGDLTLP